MCVYVGYYFFMYVMQKDIFIDSISPCHSGMTGRHSWNSV